MPSSITQRLEAVRSVVAWRSMAAEFLPTQALVAEEVDEPSQVTRQHSNVTSTVCLYGSTLCTLSKVAIFIRRLTNTHVC